MANSYVIMPGTNHSNLDHLYEITPELSNAHLESGVLPSKYKKLTLSQRTKKIHWIQQETPKTITELNKPNLLVFCENSVSVGVSSWIISYISPTLCYEYTQIQFINPLTWIQDRPASSNQIGGWKESNTLYKGNLTYHPA